MYGCAVHPLVKCLSAIGIEEVDAVVCTIGGTTANASADSEGNINIIEAAMAKGVKKFILVSNYWVLMG